MSLAIAGAGMTGAYLYRLLKNEGREVHLYDREQAGRCGLKPCAWGTSADFIELVAKSGLSAENYILRRLDHVVMDDVMIKADLITFDKPRLVKDLLGDADLGEIDRRRVEATAHRNDHVLLGDVLLVGEYFQQPAALFFLLLDRFSELAG